MGMFTVTILLCTILVTVSAYGNHGNSHSQNEGSAEKYANEHGEDNGPVHYKFDYGVADPHTGDKKEQHEVREGHVVKGSYTFKEADGTTRLVEYTVGPKSGFNAVVKRIGQASHPQDYKTYDGKQGGSGTGGGHGAAHSHIGVTQYGYSNDHQ